ncbi:MAG TPA: DUF664 domain-containing protein, partial [Candidatus Limnocylindrales bacterium]|nr:DUF664 domain-containing protein [Candidatus Limnocylindrales bacterium]
MLEFRYEDGRWQPPVAGDEISTLLGFLERQRATFAWKTSGLDSAGLRATHSPSAMTLGGMLKHLARFEDDMSAEWLHGRSQLPPWDAVDWDAEHDWDWRTAADDAPDTLYAQWRDAVVRSRDLFAEAAIARDPERRGGDSAGVRERLPTLRYILLNMIEEYARHN